MLLMNLIFMTLKNYQAYLTGHYCIILLFMLQPIYNDIE